MKILVVEDDLSLNETLVTFLKKEQYIVESTTSYRKASAKIAEYDYDCILLDIMLPDGNGLTLLQELGSMDKNKNVIIISAKDSVDDKIAGLDLGADDYLAKPFHLAELSARIRSLIRRKVLNGDNEIRVGNVRIDTTTSSVYINETELDLSRKEYDILRYFMMRPNHLIDKLRLAEAVWGDYIDQTDNFDFIYAQIKNLRKKMNNENANIEIKAVYGLGYKLAYK